MGTTRTRVSARATVVVWDDEVDVDKETCNLEIITRRVQYRGEEKSW